MLSFPLWHARFRDHMQMAGWTARSVGSYLGELRRLFAFLEEQKVTSISEVQLDILEAWRLELFYQETDGKRLTLRTQAWRLGVVRAFFRYLIAAGYILSDPMTRVPQLRVPKLLPRVLLSEEETVRLMESPPTDEPLGLRDRAMLELLYGTGIRNTELRLLTLEEVDLERRELRIRCGKGNKSRVLPLGEEAWGWLVAYLTEARSHLVRGREQHLVFVSYKGNRLTRACLGHRVAKAAKAAGLEKPVTPHVLRHCCATHMLARGAGIRHLQMLLGHESLSTTQRYTRVDVSDLHAVVARCHPREAQP